MSEPVITIYGYGYVGQAVWRFLKDSYSVQIYDPEPKDSTTPIVTDKAKLKMTKYAIICVPTPESVDGSCDTSLVEKVITESEHELYLIKSTIVPGTTKRIIEQTGKRICFSPEYIGEGKYMIPHWKDMPHATDMKLHSFHIFGGDKTNTSEWVTVWQRAGGWEPKYIQTDSTTAELTKYMVNSFLATKKIFCDEFYEIASAFGIDYNELKELWLLDGRVGRSMTAVYPDAKGFGGKCLPKDTKAIVRAAGEAGYDATLIKQVIESNEKFRSGE